MHIVWYETKPINRMRDGNASARQRANQRVYREYYTLTHTFTSIQTTKSLVCTFHELKKARRRRREKKIERATHTAPCVYTHSRALDIFLANVYSTHTKRRTLRVYIISHQLFLGKQHETNKINSFAFAFYHPCGCSFFFFTSFQMAFSSSFSLDLLESWTIKKTSLLQHCCSMCWWCAKHYDLFPSITVCTHLDLVCCNKLISIFIIFFFFFFFY